MAKNIMEKVEFMKPMIFQFRNWKLETNMTNNYESIPYLEIVSHMKFVKTRNQKPKINN